MKDSFTASSHGSSDPLGAEYEIRIQQWIDRFPFDQHCAPLYAGMIAWDHVKDVAILEQYRQQLRGTLGLFTEVPVDLFLMAKGEPKRRDVTKIGGLPYRPSGLPWPKAVDGEAMTFVAQFRFAESRDHIKSVPADMMLIFISTPSPHDGECGEQFCFEWYPLGVTDFTSASEMSTPMFECPLCYGVRHRTMCMTEPSVVDYVECEVLKWLPAIYHGRIIAEDICFVGGTKIGGVPVYWNHDPPFAPPGRFLCSLGAIGIRSEVEYPWVNRPEPLSLRDNLGASYDLQFGDVSMLNFFLDDGGNVRVTLEFA